MKKWILSRWLFRNNRVLLIKCALHILLFFDYRFLPTIFMIIGLWCTLVLVFYLVKIMTNKIILIIVCKFSLTNLNSHFTGGTFLLFNFKFFRSVLIVFRKSESRIMTYWTMQSCFLVSYSGRKAPIIIIYLIFYTLDFVCIEIYRYRPHYMPNEINHTDYPKECYVDNKISENLNSNCTFLK